jgi:5-amino-6-(5-phosphoribosylamino)uracil reductase
VVTRPRVLLDCATSLDGKLQLAPDRRTGPFAMSRHPEDARRMRALRATVDAVVIGAENLRIDDPDLALSGDDLARRIAEGRRGPIRVVVTRAGAGLRPDMRVFDPALGGESVVAHASPLVVDLGGRATLVELAGEPGSVDIGRLLAWLGAERGCATVLCEGGGVLNAAFFAARAVDEIHLTLVPRVLGGHLAPTLAAGPGFTDGQIPDATLASVERVGDELFLRYAIDWSR